MEIPAKVIVAHLVPLEFYCKDNADRLLYRRRMKTLVRQHKCGFQAKDYGRRVLC